MANESKTTGGLVTEDLMERTRSGPCSRAAPPAERSRRMEQFWKAQDAILEETEAFSKAWFERRHEATRQAVEAVHKLNGEGGGGRRPHSGDARHGRMAARIAPADGPGHAGMGRAVFALRRPRDGCRGRSRQEGRRKARQEREIETRDAGVTMAIPRGKTVIATENDKGDTAMDEKSAYRQKLEARLDQWRAEIDKLQAKAAEASADARIEYDKQIDELQEKQQDAQAKLEELNDASGDAWKDFKAGVEKGLGRPGQRGEEGDREVQLMGARQARPRIAPVLVAGCLGAVSVAVPNAAWTQQSDTETTAEETTVDDVQAEFSDAFDTIGDYSAEQRDEALARMEVTLARLDERIEETETRVREEWAGMSEATQERTSAALSALREQRNGLSEAYGALSQGAGTAWGDLMDGVQTGWSDLASAWDDATLAISNDNETGD